MSIEEEPSTPFDSSTEVFQLSKRYLILYKSFVLVDKSFITYFEKYFGIKSISYDISYIHKKKEGDIIIMKNYPLYNDKNRGGVENLILCGFYDFGKNILDTKYIFEYNNLNILDDELQYIWNNPINYYIQCRTYFDKNNKNNNIYPIISNNKKIGICYKYEECFDYTKDNNLSKYMNNRILLTAIYLYANGFYLENKINNSVNNPNDEELYLVKKKFITDMKNLINYKEIKKNYLKGKINNIPPSDKEIENIINNLSENDLNLLDNMNKNLNLNQFDPTSYEIDLITVSNPNNQSEKFMIYNDFKLLEKNCTHFLLKDMKNIPKVKLVCSFIQKNIVIFHYPINYLNNKNYICIISTVDEKHNFTNKYLLKYNDKNSYEYHISKMKQIKLEDYLKNFKFVNNVSPIVRKGYIEIGIIINLSKTVPPPPSSGSTRKNFPSKPLIGLENIGATCYMNATLQCLCIIEKFVDYFKYSDELYEIVKNDVKNEKLCSSFKNLIENLYPENDKTRKGSYAPREFKEKISKMNPLFEGIAANDAKDLVNFLIMTLHSELNKAPQNQIEENNDNIFEDQRNKDLMFNNFTSNFKKTQQSIISNLFYALNYNITQCSNCKTVSYNYQIYFFLIFPLEEVRKYKLMNNNGLNNKNEVDIYDCFEFDRKVNYMTGDNAMYCNYCTNL